MWRLLQEQENAARLIRARYKRRMQCFADGCSALATAAGSVLAGAAR